MDLILIIPGKLREDPIIKSGSTLIIKQDDVVSLTTSSMKLTSSEELDTDESISRRDIRHLDGRALQAASAWIGDESDNLSLDFHKKDVGKWNQFEVNKKLFNVQR